MFVFYLLVGWSALPEWGCCSLKKEDARWPKSSHWDGSLKGEGVCRNHPVWVLVHTCFLFQVTRPITHRSNSQLQGWLIVVKIFNSCSISLIDTSSATQQLCPVAVFSCKRKQRVDPEFPEMELLSVSELPASICLVCSSNRETDRRQRPHRRFGK